MKNQLTYFSLLSLCTWTLMSCFTMPSVITENDIVKSSERKKFIHQGAAREYNSPLLSLNQTIVHESSDYKNPKVYIYDILTLDSRSFRLDQKVYILIDEDAFHIDLEAIELDNFTSIQENNESIMTADSNYVDVVTGYNENNHNITRFSYVLQPDLVQKIQNADQVAFRYYAGPDMITVNLGTAKLQRLKKMLFE